MRWLSWRLSMQALPSQEVANEGARALQEGQPKAKLRDQYPEGKGVDASQALAEAMGEAQEANKRTHNTNQAWMLNHTLKPLEVSAWPDDLRQALERGLFCPPRTSPMWEHQEAQRVAEPWHQEAGLGGGQAVPGGSTQAVRSQER